MLNNEEHDMQIQSECQLLEMCNKQLLKQQLLSLYGYPSIQIDSERIMAYLEGIEYSSEPEQKKIIRTLISFIGEVTFIGPESNANSLIRERVQQFLLLNKIGIQWTDEQWNHEIESLFETKFSNPYYTNLLDNKFEYSRFFQFLDSPLPLQLQKLNHHCLPTVLVAKQMDDFKYLCNMYEFKNMRKIRKYIHQIITKLEEFRVLSSKIESLAFDKFDLQNSYLELQVELEDIIQQNLRLIDSTKKPTPDDKSQTANHETHTQTVTMPISQEIRNKKLKKKQKMQQKMNEAFLFPLENSQEQSKESSQDGRKLIKISQGYLEILKFQEQDIDSVDKLQIERNSEQSGCVAGQQISLENKVSLDFDRNSQSEVLNQFTSMVVEENEPELFQFESYNFSEKAVVQDLEQKNMQLENTSKSESLVEIIQVPSVFCIPQQAIHQVFNKPALNEIPEIKESTMLIQLPQESKIDANDSSWLQKIEKKLQCYCNKLTNLQKLGYPCLKLKEKQFVKMIKGFNQFYQDKAFLISQIVSVIWETLTLDNIEMDAKGDEFVYQLVKNRAKQYLALANFQVQQDVLDTIVNSSFEKTGAMPYCSEFEVRDFSFEQLAELTDRQYPRQLLDLKCKSSRLAIKTKSVEYLKPTFNIPDVQNVRITRLFIKEMHAVLQKITNFHLRLKNTNFPSQDIFTKQFNILEQEYKALVNKKLNYKLENKPAPPKIDVQKCIKIDDKDSLDQYFIGDNKSDNCVSDVKIECAPKQFEYVNLVTPQPAFTPNNIYPSPCIGQHFFGSDYDNGIFSPESKYY